MKSYSLLAAVLAVSIFVSGADYFPIIKAVMTTGSLVRR